MSDRDARTLFRIVSAGEPTLEDFRSSLQKCRRPRPAEIDDPLEWAGVSVFDTRLAVAFTARRYPQIGTHVAELRVPDISPTILRLIVLQTRGPGHYLLLGCAELLLPLVVDVSPVGA